MIEEAYINFYTPASYDSDNDAASVHSRSRRSTKSKKDGLRKKNRDHLSKINESRTHSQTDTDDDENSTWGEKKSDTYFKYSENGDDLIQDYKEIKTELNPVKDLMNTLKPSYRLKWKLEDEEIKPHETIMFNLNPIVKVQSLNNHRKKITCIDYDKNRVVTGSLDQYIFVYDFKTGTCLGKLESHKGGIKCLQILKNRLCSGSWDMTLIIWNMIRFEPVITLRQNHDSVSCIYFDMKYLIFGSHDKLINVWHFNDEYTERMNLPEVPFKTEDVINFERVIDHHKSGITCLTYDGIDCIVSANTQGTILLIDLNGVLLKELVFTMEFEPITAIRLVGALIISTTMKGSVVFWNRREKKLESIIKCNDEEAPCHSVAFCNKRFYTAENDCMIKEWDLATFTCLRQFRAHEGPVLDLIVVNNKIISCGYDKVIIWNMNDPSKKNLKPVV